MASPHIRQWFMDRVVELVPEAPFQETDGAAPVTRNLPEIWSTMESDIAVNQRLTIGEKYLERESGTFTVVFALKSGRGPMVALQLAAVFANGLKRIYQEELTETDTGQIGTIRMENVGPPNSEPYEEGNWLFCSVSCVYSYDAVRGVVPPNTESSFNLV